MMRIIKSLSGDETSFFRKGNFRFQERRSSFSKVEKFGFTGGEVWLQE
jgi:hypothetical protein